jgi:hypothetical protein
MKTAQPAALRRAFTGRNQLISIVVMIAVLVILALAPAVVTNQYIIEVL